MIKLSTPLNVMFTALLAVSLNYSCKKDADKPTAELEDAPATEEMKNVETDAEADAMFTHVYTVVHTEVSNVEDQAFKTGNIIGIAGDPSATIVCEIDSTDKKNKFVKKMTITYPDAGSNWHGLNKKGKIVVTKNKKLNSVGSVTEININRLMVGDLELGALLYLTYDGFDGYHNFTFNLNLGAVKYPDGSITYWQATRKVQLLVKANKEVEAYVTGSSIGGVSSDDVKYTSEITKDLKFVLGCKYPKDGTVKMKTAGKSDVTIEFGDGGNACTDLARVTMDKKYYKKRCR